MKKVINQWNNNNLPTSLVENNIFFHERKKEIDFLNPKTWTVYNNYDNIYDNTQKLW